MRRCLIRFTGRSKGHSAATRFSGDQQITSVRMHDQFMDPARQSIQLCSDCHIVCMDDADASILASHQ
jgi:hypothetical protein